MKNTSFILFVTLILFVVVGCSASKKTVTNSESSTEVTVAPLETVKTTEKTVKILEIVEDSRIATLKKAVESYPDSLFVLLSRTPCYGHCPVYTLKVYNSGFVIYEGKYNTEMEGVFTGNFTKENNATISTKINDIHFFEMQTIYDTNVTDFPSVHVYAHVYTAKKQIIDRQGAPKELKELETLLDALISSTKWTKK